MCQQSFLHMQYEKFSVCLIVGTWDTHYFYFFQQVNLLNRIPICFIRFSERLKPHFLTTIYFQLKKTPFDMFVTYYNY